MGTVLLLEHGEEHGGTTLVLTPTSMVCIVVDWLVVKE